jgi:hypothetical protein
MKSVIVILCVSLLLGSSGVHGQSVVDVSTHKLSYTEPPSDWKLSSSFNTPVLVGDIKLPVHGSVWAHENKSSITVLAIDLSSHQEPPTARETTIQTLELWIESYLGKICAATQFDIIDEKNGSYKGSAQVYEMTSEVTCEVEGEGEGFVTKIKNHAIDHMGFRYKFEFTARDDYYEQNYKVYAELLESIDFL